MLIDDGIWSLNVGSTIHSLGLGPELCKFREVQGIRKYACIHSSLTANMILIATSRSYLDFLETRDHDMEL